MSKAPSDVPGPIKPWTVLSQRTVIADRWLTLRADHVRTMGGAELDPFYVIDEHSWACVIPVLPDGRLVLVEQYRHGAQKIMLELPAGDLDPGEDPGLAAQRELMEETGYTISAGVKPVGVLYPEPSRNRSRGYGFVVSVHGEPRAQQQLDPGEQIRVHRLTVAETFSAITEGRIAHAVHVAFLLQARAAGLIR